MNLLELTGNFSVRYVTVFLLGLLILVNTALVRISSNFIGCYSYLFVSFGLVDLEFSLVRCMWPLAIVIDGGRYLLTRLIVNLGHLAK